ncbi:MAG: hypothetical protein A3F46_02420 [Legionellales bacterium RIFCSPHIGHO2_12_FULL_42_9]|nr:MAG: hypothetical protein A3F46_02420 [Legionellales bacterium RIFCSPHIGHO2_12_FULL_42_9]
MNHAKNLDNASGKLFLAGFMTAKIRQLPIPFIGQILGLISFSCYLIGYIMWLIASRFYPSHPPKAESWYGFTQIKNQNRTAAALGLAGVTLCLLSFAFPVLLLPGMSLFALSNIIWSIAEYHRRQNPPRNDAAYSPPKQDYYVSYAVLSTIVSVMSAASLALAIIFPPIAIPVLFFSAFVGFTMTVAACYFLLNSPPTESSTKPGAQTITESHKQIHRQLGTSSLAAKQAKENSQPEEPPFYSPLFPQLRACQEINVSKLTENKAHQSDIPHHSIF